MKSRKHKNQKQPKHKRQQLLEDKVEELKQSKVEVEAKPLTKSKEETAQAERKEARIDETKTEGKVEVAETTLLSLQWKKHLNHQKSKQKSDQKNQQNVKKGFL